jgi:hypothetical protein
LEGAIHVDGGKGDNKVLLEGSDGSFGCIDAMVVWRHNLNIQFFRPNVRFDGLGTFVVHDVEVRLVILHAKGAKDISEGCDESGIGA